MAVHASHAALPYPIKNARFSMLVPMLDADGDPTAATTPDTEVSKDNAAAADAAEEISATSGMDGMALITFTGAETDCSTLAANYKNASGPKFTLATLYPRVLAEVGTGTLSAGSAGGGTLGTLLAYDVTGCFIKTTGGTGGGGTGGANNQARKIVTYNTSSGAFTVTPNWETTPSTDTTYAVLLPEGVTLGMLKTLNPTTPGRTLVVDSAGLADANMVKAGPTGSGTAQTAGDIIGDTNDIQSRLPAALGANGNIKADIRDSLGVAIFNSDFTIASASSTTVTLPTTYTNGNSLPDDDRHIWTSIQVVSGTGAGQVVKLTTAAAGARVYNVESGTMPVQLDSTSTCVVLDKSGATQTGDAPTAATIADAVWDEALSGHTTADTAGSDLAAAKDNTDYPDGYVYFSSFAGSAGSTLGVNGTWRTPVSSWADALTLANTVGAIKFMPNTAATASGSMINRVIDLHGGSLTVDSALSLSGTFIYSTGRRGNLYGTGLTAVTVSGTELENLYVSGIIATAPSLQMRHCGLAGNVTDSTGGPNASFRPLLADCYNFKANGSAVTFTVTGGGHWHLLGWYGDLEVVGLAAGQTFYANGWGKLTIAASCTGGTIKHTSHIEILDQASGAVTTDLISEPTPWNPAWDAEVESEVTDALQATVPDSIPADGTRPSIQQACYMVCQGLFEGTFTGNPPLWRIKKVDGTTDLFTVQLDADPPTSKTRAS